MDQVSRRSFLIGSAASIAVAAIPNAVALLIESKFYERRYYGFDWFPDDPHPADKAAALVRLLRGEELIWQFGLAPGVVFRWLARSGDEISLLPQGAPLQFDVSGQFGRLDLVFEHYERKGSTAEIYLEQRDFLRSGEMMARVLPLRATRRVF